LRERISLITLKPAGAKANPVGTIFIVYRTGAAPLKRVQIVIESFWKMKNGKGG
jgi:hypothetical protein